MYDKIVRPECEMINGIGSGEHSVWKQKDLWSLVVSVQYDLEIPSMDHWAGRHL